MAAYADYTYYSGTYKGAAIAEADFPRLALEASAELNRLTFGRVAPIVDADEDADTIDLIQMATCAVADVLQQLARTDGQAIQFEMVGRHSISYAQPAPAQRRISLAAQRWLAPTNLLYRGFAAGEYSGTLDAD